MAEQVIAEATEPTPEVPPVPEEPVNETKSIVLTGYGGLKMIKTMKRPESTAKQGEVLIRVKACGLNFVDLMVRQGVIDNPPKTPVVMGFECSGEIESVGENTSGFAVGDRVIGFTDYNAWNELVSVSTNFVYKMPENMSFQDGAALAMNYITAYIMLFEMGGIKSGKSVVLHSAGGGVGHAVCQLCKSIDDVTIFGSASQVKHEAIKDNVTHLFDHVVDYAQEVRKVCPGGVDLVLDCLCGEDTNKGINLLKPMGKYILYGSSNIVTGETKSFFSFAKSWWQVDKVSPIKLYDDNRSIAGFQLRHLAFSQNCHEYIREVMDKLFVLYKEGKVRPVIDSAWAFEDVSEAMQKMHDRKNIGKIILDPGLQPKPQTKPEANSSTDEKVAKEGESPTPAPAAES